MCYIQPLDIKTTMSPQSPFTQIIREPNVKLVELIHLEAHYCVKKWRQKGVIQSGTGSIGSTDELFLLFCSEWKMRRDHCSVFLAGVRIILSMKKLGLLDLKEAVEENLRRKSLFLSCAGSTPNWAVDSSHFL